MAFSLVPVVSVSISFIFFSPPLSHLDSAPNFLLRYPVTVPVRGGLRAGRRVLHQVRVLGRIVYDSLHRIGVRPRGVAPLFGVTHAHPLVRGNT